MMAMGGKAYAWRCPKAGGMHLPPLPWVPTLEQRTVEASLSARSRIGLWSPATGGEDLGLPPGVASIPTLSPGWADWEDPLSCWETPGWTGEVAWSSWILPTGESPSLRGTGPETSCLPIAWGKRLSWHCRKRERSSCLWEESWTLRGLSALPSSPWVWWRVPFGLESKLLTLGFSPTMAPQPTSDASE